MPRLDEIDRRLLQTLVSDGRATFAELGRVVGLTAASVYERVRKLEETGVIAGYTTTVDAKAVSRGVAAFVALTLPASGHQAEIETALEDDDAVLEVHEVAGEDCYLVKLRVESPEDLSAALARLRDLHPSARTRSTIVLRTVFERGLLADPGRADGEPVETNSPKSVPDSAA